MKLVTRDDIASWASSFEAKGELPHLISRLVYTTTPNSTEVRFPSGSAVFLGGWDGIVKCKEDTRFIPKGVSCFEIGAEKNSKGKSSRDYNKRENNTLGFKPDETTYIFITPYVWKDKDKWIKEKQAEALWKEVKVYDGIDLEQWLEISLPTAKWFAPKINKYPSGGYQLIEEFWDEWSTGPKKLKLTPDLVVAGRERERSLLLDFLNESADVRAIRASTRDEAIAFIAAAAKLFSQSDSERFFSKTIIVGNADAFRVISSNNKESLNLIANFEDMGPIYTAASKGHQILIPFNPEDDINKDAIVLPTIDREGFVNALVGIGFSEDQARKYSLESGRNITILKKMLGFLERNSDRYEKKNIHEIIPALLLGRWDENFEGDIELIEKLTGEEYDEYLVTLNRWAKFENAPILHVGNIWRLTSPLDMWTNISQYLTYEDLNNLKNCFNQAFSTGNPFIDSGAPNEFAIFNQKRKYSNWSREGLVQSLIMVGLRGDALKFPYSQSWVDQIIYDLLYNATAELWTSVNKELPLIAEASPKSFLNTVSHSLEKKTPEILGMFKEEKGMFDSNYHYTGLLWALEGLAWFPEYLGRAAIILLKLDNVISVLKWVNSPLNSLQEIFRPWYYQTLSPFKERMEILKNITHKEPESGWNLLIKLLPQEHEFTHQTHKTRWRIFDQNTNIKYNHQEIWETYSYIMDLLFDLFDGNESKFSMLMENLVSFPYQEDRLKIYDWAEKVYSHIEQSEYKPWNSIREILHHHRSYPNAKWALPESELQRLENLYHKLEPEDIVKKFKWLFESNWPKYPEGHKRIESDKLYHEKNRTFRTNIAGKWVDQFGLDKTIALRKDIKEPALLGEALAEVIKEEDEILAVCEYLNSDYDVDFPFIQAFICAKSLKEGIDWVKELARKLDANGCNVKAISNLLVSVGSNEEIWAFVDSLSEDQQDAYWENEHLCLFVETTHDAIEMINKLNSYKRFFTALELCNRSVNNLPTDLLIETLWRASTEDASEEVRLDNYVIGEIFDDLYQRDDLDISLMKKIEWNYISFFDEHSLRKPKYLQDELTTNPSFFIEVIKWIYFPNDREEYYEDKKGVSEEKIQLIARHSKMLLDTWDKIPGMQDDYSINENGLRKWIKKARNLAKEIDRQEVADVEIGSLLARYPEGIDKWPQESIFQIIEEIHSEELNRHYSIALFNKRGSSVRGPFDGGDIERDHARYFNKLASDYKIKYSTVSEIFSDLANDYLTHAKQMDQQAKLEELEY